MFFNLSPNVVSSGIIKPVFWVPAMNAVCPVWVTAVRGICHLS